MERLEQRKRTSFLMYAALVRVDARFHSDPLASRVALRVSRKWYDNRDHQHSSPPCRKAGVMSRYVLRTVDVDAGAMDSYRRPQDAEGGVIGCKQFSWLRGVGCGLSSAFEYGGPCCDRCGAGVWVVPGAHRQNARPVPVGDQPRDQAQRGRRRVLQGRGGGAHGRTPTRPSQGARHRCRPCSAVPCLVRPRPGPNAPPDQRAPQGRSAWRGWGAMCWLPSSRWAYDQPRGDFARGSTRHRGGGTS